MEHAMKPDKRVYKNDRVYIIFIDKWVDKMMSRKSLKNKNKL